MAEISLHEYCEQIESVIEQGRYAEAVAHGKCILEHYPKHAATYRLLGKAMIEAGQDEYATDMFHRVLSADPEDVLAWAAMSEVHGRRGELDAAVWCLERAFELAIDNRVVEEELRYLYSRRDGVEPQRVQLTRGALARLYLKGDLLSRAISGIRALLAEHPEQVDLNIALAEALWRNEQRLEASEVCQQVLDILPYCLKVNLLLGEIWTSSGREEGQAYLRRAEALDPENLVAQEFFGTASPLPEREVWIVPLEYKPPTEEERPAWMAGLEEAPLGAREAALVDITAALEAQIEIPSWLEEIVVEEAVAPAPSGLVEPSEEQLLEEVVTAPAEEVPDWLAGISEGFVEEEAGAAGEEEALAVLVEAEIPDWLAELGAEVAGDQVPALEEAPSPAVEEAPQPAWLEGEGIPSGDEALVWLEGLAAGKEEELRARAEAEGEARMAEIMGRPKPVEPPIEEVVPDEVPPAPVPAEIPDWLRELAPPEAAAPAVALPAIEEAAALLAEEPFDLTAFGEPEAPPVAEEPLAVEEAPPVAEPVLPEAPLPVAEEAPLPAWLEGEGIPSGDDALAWLEGLAVGKEEELRAQAEAEGEARMAEIMGRPKPAEPPVAEIVLEEAPPAPVPAEVPDWLRELAPPEAAIPEAAPPRVEAALPEAPAPVMEEEALPAWLEGEGIPSGDEALAWLEGLAAGKEEELRARAEAEGEARMAEIMGRPKPVEPPIEEVVPEEVPLAPVPAEIPDWLRELAPPEAVAPAVALPAIEAALEEAPAPLVEEAAAPPAEEAFGWTAFGEPEALPEAVEALPVAEKVPSPKPAFGWTVFGEPEAPPEAVLPVEDVVPPGVPEWARLEEVEAPPVIEIPVVEGPPPEEILEPEVVPPAEEIAPAPVIEEIPGVVEMEVLEPIEEIAAPPEAPAVGIAAEQAYLKKHPRDYETWLALAQALWQAGERKEALGAYTRVVRAGKFLGSVTSDLEGYVEQQPDASTLQVLGDAYMKDGRLQEALDVYRRALEAL